MFKQADYWNVDVTGGALDRLSTQLGRRVTGGPNRRATGDYTGTRRAYLARIWVNDVIEAELEGAREASYYRLIVILDGDMVIGGSLTSIPLSEGNAVVISPGARHTLQCDQQCARIEVGLASELLPMPPSDLPSIAVLSSSLAKPLTALVNAILANRLKPQAEGWPYLEAALITLVRGTLSDFGDDDDPHARALLHLPERSIDPEFKVSDLAREMHMSVRTLLRAFEKHGTTPSQEIARARAARAARYLAEDTTNARSLEEIAHLSGFRSVRMMQDVRRRLNDNETSADHGEPSPE